MKIFYLRGFGWVENIYALEILRRIWVNERMIQSMIYTDTFVGVETEALAQKVETTFARLDVLGDLDHPCIDVFY